MSHKIYTRSNCLLFCLFCVLWYRIIVSLCSDLIFPWWRHQMETFSALLAIYAGTHKGQWRGALRFSLICAAINGWESNRKAGDLRRHCAHYDVTVMRISGTYHFRISVDIFTCMPHQWLSAECWLMIYFDVVLKQHQLSKISLHTCAWRQINVYARYNTEYTILYSFATLRDIGIDTSHWNTN